MKDKRNMYITMQFIMNEFILMYEVIKYTP